MRKKKKWKTPPDKYYWPESEMRKHPWDLFKIINSACYDNNNKYGYLVEDIPVLSTNTHRCYGYVAIYYSDYFKQINFEL